MSDLFDWYERDYLPDLTKQVQHDYHLMIVHLRSAFGEMSPQDVKPRHVRDFLEVKTGRIHRNRMVMILSSVFTKAIAKYCIDDDLRNPCWKIERWPTPPRDRYVTDEEFAAVRELAPVTVQIAMDLAWLTSQRQSDIIRLKWSSVTMTGPRDRWHIEIRQGKTGKRLAIRISEALELVLNRAKEHPARSGETVIRRRDGRGFTSHGFRSKWQRVIRQWGKLGHERFHFHDLRAKSISDNESLDAAYGLAGHIDIAMTRRVYDRGVRFVQPLR